MARVNGVTFLTAFALLCGVAAHILKQLITARRNRAGVTARDYLVVHWPETLLATISAAVLYLGLPEIAVLFPDLSSSLGVGTRQSVLSSFVVGFMANSIADFLGGRARTISGVPK